MPRGPEHDDAWIDRRVALWLSGVITAVWTVSTIVDAFVKSYDPPPTIGALMLLVAGGVFGEGILRTRRNGKNGGNGNGGNGGT